MADHEHSRSAAKLILHEAGRNTAILVALSSPSSFHTSGQLLVFNKYCGDGEVILRRRNEVLLGYMVVSTILPSGIVKDLMFCPMIINSGEQKLNFADVRYLVYPRTPYLVGLG